MSNSLPTVKRLRWNSTCIRQGCGTWHGDYNNNSICFCFCFLAHFSYLLPNLANILLFNNISCKILTTLLSLEIFPVFKDSIKNSLKYKAPTSELLKNKGGNIPFTNLKHHSNSHSLPFPAIKTNFVLCELYSFF